MNYNVGHLDIVNDTEWVLTERIQNFWKIKKGVKVMLEL
jgi:hypothetical protein